MSASASKRSSRGDAALAGGAVAATPPALGGEMKGKRAQVARACGRCAAGKRKCSGTFPCDRCVRLGLADSCTEVVLKREVTATTSNRPHGASGDAADHRSSGAHGASGSWGHHRPGSYDEGGAVVTGRSSRGSSFGRRGSRAGETILGATVFDGYGAVDHGAPALESAYHYGAGHAPAPGVDASGSAASGYAAALTGGSKRRMERVSRDEIALQQHFPSFGERSYPYFANVVPARTSNAAFTDEVARISIDDDALHSEAESEAAQAAMAAAFARTHLHPSERGAWETSHAAAHGSMMRGNGGGGGAGSIASGYVRQSKTRRIMTVDETQVDPAAAEWAAAAAAAATAAAAHSAAAKGGLVLSPPGMLGSLQGVMHPAAAAAAAAAGAAAAAAARAASGDSASSGVAALAAGGGASGIDLLLRASGETMEGAHKDSTVAMLRHAAGVGAPEDARALSGERTEPATLRPTFSMPPDVGVPATTATAIDGSTMAAAADLAQLEPYPAWRVTYADSYTGHTSEGEGSYWSVGARSIVPGAMFKVEANNSGCLLFNVAPEDVPFLGLSGAPLVWAHPHDLVYRAAHVARVRAAGESQYIWHGQYLRREVHVEEEEEEGAAAAAAGGADTATAPIALTHAPADSSVDGSSVAPSTALTSACALGAAGRRRQRLEPVYHVFSAAEYTSISYWPSGQVKHLTSVFDLISPQCKLTQAEVDALAANAPTLTDSGVVVGGANSFLPGPPVMPLPSPEEEALHQQHMLMLPPPPAPSRDPSAGSRTSSTGSNGGGVGDAAGGGMLQHSTSGASLTTMLMPGLPPVRASLPSPYASAAGGRMDSDASAVQSGASPVAPGTWQYSTGSVSSMNGLAGAGGLQASPGSSVAWHMQLPPGMPSGVPGYAHASMIGHDALHGGYMPHADMLHAQQHGVGFHGMDMLATLMPPAGSPMFQAPPHMGGMPPPSHSTGSVTGSSFLPSHAGSFSGHAGSFSGHAGSFSRGSFGPSGSFSGRLSGDFTQAFGTLDTSLDSGPRTVSGYMTAAPMSMQMGGMPAHGMMYATPDMGYGFVPASMVTSGMAGTMSMMGAPGVGLQPAYAPVMSVVPIRSGSGETVVVTSMNGGTHAAVSSAGVRNASTSSMGLPMH